MMKKTYTLIALAIFSSTAFADVAMPTVPALNVQFQCGECDPGNAQANILSAYKKAADDAGYQVTQDMVATLTVDTYKARSKGLAAFGPIGLLAAQSKIAGKIVNGASTQEISESGFGADRAGEVVGQKVFAMLSGKVVPAESKPVENGFGF